MKTHKKHKLAIFGSIFILAIIVLGSTSDFNDPITNSVAFEITSPSIDTFTGTVIEVSGTVCFAKTQTSLIDLRSDGTIGGIIESSNSPFLIDNPQFTLNELNSATTGETIDQIGHFLKIRCETGFTEGQGNPSGATEQNQIACEDPARSSECTAANTTPIQFRPSSIEVEIWAEDKNGLDKRVFGPRAYTTETVILLHGNEEILLFEQIDIDQVLQKMDTGDYSTDVTVKTSGILNLAFEGTNETFQYYIGKTHVPTTFDLKVRKSVV